MARRANRGARRSKSRSSKDDNEVIERYGIFESHANLRGFHPKVTGKSIEEVVRDFLKLRRENNNKPTREQLVSSRQHSRKAKGLRNITVAPLLVRTQWRKDGLTTDNPSPKHLTNLENCKLLQMLRVTEVGAKIIEYVFFDGQKTAQALAMTCTDMWQEVIHLSGVWDFFGAEFLSNGFNGVFLAATPHYTVSEVRAGAGKKSGKNSSRQQSWQNLAISTEANIFRAILLFRKHFGPINPFWGSRPDLDDTESVVPKKIKDKIPVSWIRAMRAIRSLESVGTCSQFLAGPPDRQFVPPANFALNHLQCLMSQIDQRSKSMSVLHFQETPYLDKRLLAIILRSCPNVQMLGIYNCPSVHFGDVIPILDLIHEINIQRTQDESPEIQAFDFYPKYENGMPYQHPKAEAYGVGWNSSDLDVSQRGFYMIIMKAFFKSLALNLDLLFDKNHAFVEYLFRVPNPPLHLPMFLSALHRYTELDSKQENAKNERKKVCYDLLKPVRLGLVKEMERDWPNWYIHKMGECLVFCTSCGYEAFEEFFPNMQRLASPENRVCAGCMLQADLELMPGHMLREKRRIVNAMCSKHRPNAFNVEAPVHRSAKGLLNLKTTQIKEKSSSDPPNERRYLRNHKLAEDSLQGLPTLQELTSGSGKEKIWKEGYNQANYIDMHIKTLHSLRDQFAKESANGCPAFKNTRRDGAAPDTIDELQGRSRGVDPMGHRTIESFTFDSAWEFHDLLDRALNGQQLPEPKGFW